MATQVIQNVPDTAFLVAMYRAKESTRKDALFVDPYASLLAGERGKEMERRLTKATVIGAWSIAIRTVIIDELISRAIENGADTIVNLGAGLDARPYRMALPESLRWIEVDFPDMIELKERRLAEATATCKVERVKLNLADIEARKKLFAEIDAKSKHIVVLTEGVIPYLSIDDVGPLADDVASMTHVRSWIVDYFSRDTIRYRKRATKDFQNAPFIFDPDDWFAFFAKHGWKTKEERYLVDESEKLQRKIPMPLPMKIMGRLVRLFSRAGAQKMRRYVGIFLMVRNA